MRYLIVGLGSIGKRHLGNIRTLDPSSHITIWHTHTKKSGKSDVPAGANRVVYSLEEAVESKPEIAFITNPAPSHVPIALRLANYDIDLFLEKPISSEMAGVDQLLRIQKKKKKILMVGYSLRFHPPLQLIKQCIDDGNVGKILSVRAEVGQYLPDWRPGTDYRKSVSAKRDLGGGAVLEISHELDYVRWFAGEIVSVSAQTAQLSDLEIDVEDIAEIILNFSSGAIGSVHLDMIQRPMSRSCKIIGTEGTIIWDGENDSVTLYSVRTCRWIHMHPAEKVERNQMFIGELRHFLSCVRERRQPLVTGEDGKRVLQIALAVHQSSREQRSIEL